MDITLSNPPFVRRELFYKFHNKAMETTRKYIYWLINISCLNIFTGKRMEEMKNKNWFLNSIHIVSDKRWYGRYCWVQFSRVNNNFFTSSNKLF